MLEMEVGSTITGSNHSRIRQFSEFRLQLIDCVITAVAGIDINDENSTHCAGSDTNLGIRPLRPPLTDGGRVPGCIFEALLRDRGFLFSKDGENRPTGLFVTVPALP